jgi:hypothetical protein
LIYEIRKTDERDGDVVRIYYGKTSYNGSMVKVTIIIIINHTIKI